MKDLKSAFTLVELLVVIAIFAAMIAFGIAGLNEFTNRTYVNTATQDFYTTSKTFIQRARNSVYTEAELHELRNGWTSTCSFTGTQFPPEAIGYRFVNGEAKYIKCSQNSSLSADFCCVEVDNEDLAMRYDQKVNVQPQGDCKGVIFEYATGEVYSFSGDNILTINTTKQTCEIQIKHNNIGYSKSLLFDGDKNEIRNVN